jgi:hypothetical protein
MTRLLLYLAIAYIIWRVVRVWAAKARRPPDLPRRDRTEQVDDRRRDAPPIDYTNVRDARYRDVDRGEEEGG